MPVPKMVRAHVLLALHAEQLTLLLQLAAA